MSIYGVEPSRVFSRV